MTGMLNIIALRGGGDLASGVALRLLRVGLPVLILEQERPLTVRRRVAFAQAVFDGETNVEGITARVVPNLEEAQELITTGAVPVLVEPGNAYLEDLKARVIVDARMLKEAVPSLMGATQLLVGIGPGFVVGENCHVVVESKRGHALGRVIWDGSAELNTGIPGSIAKHNVDRVLRSPADGFLEAAKDIGEAVNQGEVIASVSGQELVAPFAGVLRGLIHASVSLHKGMKIGDLDPRNDAGYVELVSDKALGIGGGVLEAILAQPLLRSMIQHD